MTKGNLNNCVARPMSDILEEQSKLPSISRRFRSPTFVRVALDYTGEKGGDTDGSRGEGEFS